MLILGIESSCDETAAAVVKNGREVLSSVIASQVEEHRLYGGVVPEIASRRHTENIVEVVDEALKKAGVSLKEIDAVAVTYAPGLIGALLVGVNFAKGLAASAAKPLIPVHHIRGHVAANYIAHPDLKPPFLCLVASGGHSHIVRVEDYTWFRVLGRTRDDAAGEAFDKAARAMGYPYPGGVQIDKNAKEGNSKAYALPRPKVDGSPYDFSFSGLKTAVINLIHNSQQKGIEINKQDLCAAFQETVAEILTDRLMLAAKDFGYSIIAAAGGVSANSGLRASLQKACDEKRYTLYLPSLSLCGDNAAMIAAQGYYEYLAGNLAGPDLNGYATMNIEESYQPDAALTVKQAKSKWLHAVAPNLTEQQKREHVVGNGNFLWHVFSWDYVDCLSGDAAREEFDLADKSDAYYFRQDDRDESGVLPADKYWDSFFVDEYLKGDLDLYVVDASLRWTYVKTHEEMCGPYFLKIK